MTTPLDDTMVVFDWNGTIMSDLRRAVCATNRVLTARGIGPLTEHEFQDGFHLPLRGWLAGLGVGAAAAPEAEREWNAALSTVPARPRAEALDVLAELVERGAVTGVVSAASTEAVRADVDASGMAGLFRQVAGGVDDKARHLAALRHHRERAFYVGDTEYDVASARTAGFVAVAVTGGYRPAEVLERAGADVVIASLRELLDVVG